MHEHELIEGCLNENLRHQKELYHHYAPLMMGVCMRYSSSQEEAQDILQDGFVTVFKKLDTYRGEGELGAWIRKIILNTALQNYRKNKKHLHVIEIDEKGLSIESNDDIISSISVKELMYKIQQLPNGFRTVFNLYAIEGYKHHEIAKILEISEGTSKSQFSRARAQLIKIIESEKIREKAI